MKQQNTHTTALITIKTGVLDFYVSYNKKHDSAMWKYIERLINESVLNISYTADLNELLC